MDVAQRLKRAREELAVIDDQLAALSDVADEARIRSLVSETSLAQREYTEAQPPRRCHGPQPPDG